MTCIFPIGNVIIPIDSYFSEGWAQPPTRQLRVDGFVDVDGFREGHPRFFHRTREGLDSGTSFFQMGNSAHVEDAGGPEMVITCDNKRT